MRVINTVLLVAPMLSWAASAGAAGYYDGESTLLCTAFRMEQCDAADGCVKVKPEDIDAGTAQWIVDFKHKSVKRADPNSRSTSQIASVQYIEGTLYAQAIEAGNPNALDGIAWSLSVSDPDGAMSLAAVSRAVAFYGEGACVPMR
jgi:hypothetical protein